jgi:hypothetical protein
MALKGRVWGAGKLLLLGGGLLLTYVLFAFAGMRIALKTREVVVPDLQGKSVNEAAALLADAASIPKFPQDKSSRRNRAPDCRRAASEASGSGSARARA